MHRLKKFPKLGKLELEEFSNPFLEDQIARVEQYAFLRVRGLANFKCLINAFGAENAEDPLAPMRVARIESSNVYLRAYEAALKEAPTPEIWNEKVSLQILADLANHPHEKGTTKLAATKEANVLTGATIVDEKGNTRARPGLADFYADSANLKNPPPVEYGVGKGEG